MTDTIEMTVAEIHQLATDALRANGCDDANAEAIANTVSTAERDGSESHGLFRIPGYVNSMRSGKVNGKADPQSEVVTPAIIRMQGDNGYTPLAIERGVPELAKAAKAIGIAAMPTSTPITLQPFGRKPKVLQNTGWSAWHSLPTNPKSHPPEPKKRCSAQTRSRSHGPGRANRHGCSIWLPHPERWAIYRLLPVTGTKYHSVPVSMPMVTRPPIRPKLQMAE